MKRWTKVASVLVVAWACGDAGALLAHEEALLSFEEVAAGTWGWDAEGLGCDENPHTIEFPDDGGTMVLRYAHGPEGEPAEPTVYDLLGEGPASMRMRIQGETRTTDAGVPVVWDLVLLSPDSYCWRRTDWQEGGCTQPIHRCSEKAE